MRHYSVGHELYNFLDFENREVDFRYFQWHDDTIGWSGFEIYHWSPGLKAVRIENVGRKDLIFRDGGDTYVCKAGRITLIEKPQFRKDGFFMPDTADMNSALCCNCLSLISGMSIDHDRITCILKRLAEAWLLYPSMRLGQLIATCVGIDKISGIGDDEMLVRLMGYICDMRKAGL